MVLVYYKSMWIIGIIAAVIVLVFALVLSKYEEALLDSDDTFKFFLGGFFVVFIAAGIVMKLTLPALQGPASIMSLKEAIIHPASAFQQ